MNILLVEDASVDAEVIRRALATESGAPVHIEHVTTVQQASAKVESDEFDIILLDLHLPDESNLQTLRRMRQITPETPIIAITRAFAEEDTAVRAMRLGAQDYILKDDLKPELLRRSIRYAIERNRLILELDEKRRSDNRERDSARYAALSGSSSVTAQMFGVAPLETGLPETFAQLSRKYEEVLAKAIEARSFKVDHDPAPALSALADELGFLNCGPRDLIDVHCDALKRSDDHENPLRGEAMAEEGRLLVLQMMGYLASYYRNQSIGAAVRSAPKPRPERTES